MHPSEGIIRVPAVFSSRLPVNGSVVSLRVVDVLGGGYYRVLRDGRGMKAFARIPLREGQIIRVRVHRSDTRVELHIIRPRVASLNISNPPDALSVATLRAGMALPEDNESRRRSALLARSSGPGKRMTRLYAELLAKGMDPTADLLEFVEDFFSERSGRYARKPSLDWNSNAASLKEHLTSKDPPVNKGDIIDLINLKQGKNAPWYFQDSIIRIAGREYRTVWKIRHGLQPALALGVHDEDCSLEFLIEGIKPAHLEVFATEGHRISQQAWENFRQKIGKLEDIHVGPEIRPILESDGFTP